MTSNAENKKPSLFFYEDYSGSMDEKSFNAVIKETIKFLDAEQRKTNIQKKLLKRKVLRIKD